MLTLGSLFDGSGGFPLAGCMVGIKPLWSSEIEPYPLRVTAARFPEVKQLGDVTKINGGEIDRVDIITFGSPCQDLSVAGKQLGIHDGQRSNLFFEAVRIIKEMRNADKADGRTGVDIRPRFAVWENVPGAFSSSKGEDFGAVLEALAGVCEDGLDIPRPPKGRWNHAGGVAGDGWSIAWRVYDAQYWGVAQRRKRIYLVADFGSERAGEILFERESVRGNPAESGAAGEGTAGDAERGAGRGRTVGCMNPWDVQSKHIMSLEGKSEALCSGEKRWGALPPNVCYPSDGVKCLNPWDCQSKRQYSIDGAYATLNAGNCAGGQAHGVVYDARGNGDGYTLPTLTGDHENRVTDYTAICVGNGQLHQMDLGDKTGTLNCMHNQQAVIHAAEPPRKYIVRRLTPTECARLQGFPDWWTDGVEGSDSAQYKMWGNGIALPCAVDVLGRIAKEADYAE